MRAVTRINGMTQPPHELPTDLETAHQLIAELLETVRTQGRFIEKLQHQLEQLLRRIYGRKSEKLDPNQLLLFARELLETAGDDPAATGEPTPAPPQETAPAAEPAPPKKPGHGRKSLPKHLLRRREVHDVPAELLPCPDCGALRVCIGEEVREQLEYVPACMMVIQHVRPKYACKACEGNVVIAERLPEPIEKGLPGPGLLAQVIVSKYADHLPLNRQEGILRRHGVELPRSTTCDWMAVCAGLLEPIVKQMHREILQSRVIQTDDTPVTVLDKVKGRYQGRLWIHLGDRDHPHVVFDFTTDRSGAGPERMLKGYQGYLQADAYSAYDRLYADGTIVEVGCWMHARRKFFEAKTSDPLRSHQALAWIRGLYAVEREAKTKELDDAQRLTLRQEQSRPILETIKEWLDKEVGQVLPKSPMAEAIGYALHHWKALERYLEAGFLEIDNGASERGLRPVAVGRNNWLFVGSEAGGKTAAILMSLCATCKRVGIDPLAYLRDVLERISTHPASRIAELVPDQWRKIRAGPDQGESPSTSADP
jgi:transposase